ncbi:polysaccharide biosynthesis protein [Acinetobacter terrae]|uniref:polysaccharide biosynthesis protein n=1 Tax=Acinetobacter terrae TaxID=2731247 RepID=UPI001D17ECD5|nr:polysaccharide biosynthesis protein [Acinetobacter terrae]
MAATHLSGYKPLDEKCLGDIAIQFTDLCLGEKLYEKLLINAENVEQTGHERILKFYERYFEYYEINNTIKKLGVDYQQNTNIENLKKYLKGFLEDYT